MIQLFFTCLITSAVFGAAALVDSIRWTGAWVLARVRGAKPSREAEERAAFEDETRRLYSMNDDEDLFI